ncbi:hypothetical protein UCD39_26720 [Nitrospirillum sp. BR 11752]|uniref:hypothetical protein n=1 Tax=Nitrospirillum sp. BR 11752 TaxID=3104293 RepID=UPI002ECEC609|nr:hypothetical protein [Nitrospirillum sp. BR 11752]
MLISMVVTKAYFLNPMMWFPLLCFILVDPADLLNIASLRIGNTGGVVTVTKVPHSLPGVNFFLICFHKSRFGVIIRQRVMAEARKSGRMRTGPLNLPRAGGRPYHTRLCPL